jgi:threonyl-tRNA synthetase
VVENLFEASDTMPFLLQGLDMADITVLLPDGSSRTLQSGATVRDLAASIGAGLAKAAIAGKINNELVDLASVMPDGASVAIITEKSPEALEIIRHSTSHLMAQAVKSLFPQAKVTIGPAIETGFYYDFDVDHPFTPEDLEKIEKKMQELAKKSEPILRQELSSSDAI